jgi:hypothetical protein|tara:strand:- start:137 stop:637 length:501 start_codon:yes stop_codon:yes gene_type:complete
MGELQKIPEFGIGKDFETAVTKLENDLKAMADGKGIIAGTKDKPIVNDNDQIPIDHFFMDGVYVRKMTMYQGYIVIGAIHKHRHMCFLLEGHLSVASSTGVKEYKAPCYIISEPGEKRILYAHEDSHWYNTHKNPDNIEDVQELEKQIVALSYEEYKKYKKYGKNK